MNELHFDTEKWAERRRRFDLLEQQILALHLANPDEDSERLVQALRYVVSFARMTAIRNGEGVDIDVMGPMALHARFVADQLEPRLKDTRDLWSAIHALPGLVAATRTTRSRLLEQFPLDRESLEAEVSQKLLAIASGGGGGAGFVYPGCYDELERCGLVPSLMVGTSIGALVSLFRARRLRYDPAPMVQAGKRLAWSNVFRVLETQNRYGLPATLRLYLRAALSELFKKSNGEPILLSDMEIPLYVIATGITVDALKHDLGFYEHLLDDALDSGLRGRLNSVLKIMGVLRDFLSRPDALIEMVLGRTPGTEDFDALDAAGFSASIPGVIHYDVLREDMRMKQLLDQLYARYGITRLGEGGMVANVPARIAWETVVAGKFHRRNVLVLALDCFAPHSGSLGWLPLQQAVKAANVDAHRRYADIYIPFTKTLSPMNLVPPVRDFLTAMQWGKERIQPYLPLIQAMMEPIPVLKDESIEPVI